MSLKKLTAKQEMFCREYIVDFNATQAAIRAGYSKNTAGQIGEQNLKKLEIEKKINELKKEVSSRTDVTTDDLTLFFKGIMDNEYESTKDRIRAAENVAKRIGYYKEHNSQKAQGIANSLLAYAAKFKEEKND